MEVIRKKTLQVSSSGDIGVVEQQNSVQTTEQHNITNNQCNNIVLFARSPLTFIKLNLTVLVIY